MTNSTIRISLPLVSLVVGLLPAGAAVAAPGDFVEDDASVVWHVHGQDGSSFGWAVSELADIDGDGAMEALVGAPGHVDGDGPVGLLVALSGRTGEELMRWQGEPGSLLGYAMADAGDVDGDGIHDIVVGAPGAGEGGRVYVYSGADGSVLLSVDAEAPGDSLGSAVAGAGDVDGDGLADVLAGAETADIDPAVDDRAGRAYVIGGDGGFIHTIVGAEAGGNLGSATAFVGDLDGDGIPDPFIGARSAGRGGAAVVHRGSDGTALLTVDGGVGSGAFGWFFVATVGDVDGDTTPDLYVGDFSSSVNGNSSGRVHMFSGQTGAPLFEIAGTGAGQGLGPGRGAGDVNGDGVPDLIAGSYSSSDGASQSGRLTWFSGVDGAALRDVTSLESGEQLGFDAVGLGDANADGILDVLASGASGDNVYVIAGIPLGDDGGSGTGGSETGGSETGGSGTSGTTQTGGGVSGESTAGGATVSGGEEGPGPTTSSGGEGTTGGGSAGSTSSAGGSDDGGGGCRVSGRAGGLGAWSLLLAMGWRRRRRS